MTHNEQGKDKPGASARLLNSASVLLFIGCLLVLGGWAATITYITYVRAHPPELPVNFTFVLGLVQCLVAVVLSILAIRARRGKTALWVGQLLIAAALAGVVVLLVPRLYQ